MNSLSYEIDGVRADLTFPSTIAECSGEQLTAVAAACLGRLDEAGALREICGLPGDVVAALSPFQKFKLIEALEPLFDFQPANIVFKEWKFPVLDIGGQTYHGPENSFGNVTWGEFIYADQCMINGLHQAAIAALFRPERAGWDGETDRRVPFTTHGTRHRFPNFDGMDEARRMAVVWNYRAVRNASVEAAYPALFPYYDPAAKPEKDDEEEETGPKDEPAAFSWINVHRSILGENIQDEDKFLNLSMHTVLFRLNTMAVESRKRKNI